MSELTEETTENKSWLWSIFNKPTSLSFGIMVLLVLVGWIGFIVNAYNDAKNLESLSSTKNQLITSETDAIYLTGERDRLKARLKQYIYNPDVDKLVIGKTRDYILHYYKKTPPIFADILAIKIIQNCSKHKIDPAVVIGVIEQESGFNPYSVSKANARGLMQVRHSVWGEQLEITDKYALHEIDTGIDAGIRVLKNYLASNKGDLAEALYLYVGKDRKYVKDVYANIGKFGVFGSLTGEGEDG